MEINQEMIKLLNKYGVDCNLGLLYLLGVYHGLDGISEIIPEETVRKVNSLGIVERDYKTNTLDWHLALYSGQNTDSVWEWVNDYRKLFADKNKERAGSKKSCVQRMKTFFQQNPDVRKQEVLDATAMYLRTVEAQYVKMAERFIFDGQGAWKTSMLLQWVERVRETQQKNAKDPTIKMMK